MTALTKAFLGDAVVAGGLVVLAGVDVGVVGTPASLVETTLHSVTLPANALPVAAGKACLRIRAWGGTTNNNHDKTIRFKFGSSGFPFVLTAPTTAVVWIIDVLISGDRVNQQSALFITVIDPATGAVLGVVAEVKGDSTEDGTAPIAIVVTGQNGTATVNDIVGNGLVVEYLSSPT